jgi:hypothetical protein
MQSVPFVDRQPKIQLTADCECCSGRWNPYQGWSNGPLTLQEEKRQKAEQSQKAPEASAFSSSSSMSPLLAAVAEKRASLGKNKDRRKATREERAAERERALLKKQRAEHWQGIKR